MMKWAIGLLFAALAAGCSDKCDLAEQLEARAGSGAIDCGRVGLGESSTTVDACVTDAFRTKRPFFARYELQGRDSQVVFGIAQDAGGTVTFLTWDSDPSGGSGADPVISGDTCVGPSLDEARTSATSPVFACERQDSLGMTCQ